MFLKKFFIFLFLLSSSNLNAEVNHCPKVISLLHTESIHFSVNMCRTARSFGAVGDGITDDTDALITAFTSGVNLDLEGKRYLIDLGKPGLAGGLMPHDNTIIEGNGAEIILKSNNLPSFSMITLANSKNVKIYNLKLTGDVKKHAKTSGGEWGMGFSMLGTKNCELHHVEANEMWGDGFYVGAYGKESNEEGGILNSSARANRRAGMAVSRCKNFMVKDCTFTDTGIIEFVFPAYGVDIEPNPNDYDSIEGIRLINIKTENNQGGGVLLVPRNLEFSTHPNPLFNIYMEKVISKNDGNSKYSLVASLRFVEHFSETTYDGLININGFKVIDLETEEIPFRWERNDASILEIHAINLRVNGVVQDDYHY